nr:type III-A CRISPR-associated protein Csm2 [uncultured Selenomonas sp.]
MDETRKVQEAVHDIAGEAEAVVKTLNRRTDRQGREQIQLTKSQIRKFLAAVNALTNKVAVYRTQSGQSKLLSDALASEVKYLKVKLVYQAARNRGTVGDLADKAQIKERIDRIGTDMKKYEEFAHFMEALVAYHKFYGGRD